MHHIEGAASGLPVIYHKDCGGINEMCSLHGEEYSNLVNFKSKLELVAENLKKYKNKINMNSLNIEYCCAKFYEEILAMFK